MKEKIKNLLIKNRIISYVEGYGYYSIQPFGWTQGHRFVEELCKLVLEDSELTNKSEGKENE